MCAPSPPPAPDYTAAARTQGASNLQTALAQSILNRPNEVTPYGTRSWTQSGSTQIPGAEGNPAVDIPLWQSNVNLTPLGQKTFDTQQRISDQVGSMAESGLSRVNQATSTPFGIGNVKELQDKAEGVIMGRLQPQLDRQREAMTSSLMARGHNPQNESYGAQMGQFGQQENDARQQAVLAALNYGPQLMQQELAVRNQPLNELNALRTGAQVNVPQFNQTQAGQIGQTPIMQGAMAQGGADMQAYNAQAQGDAGMWQGLFGLGGAIAGLPTAGGGSLGGNAFMRLLS